MKKHLSSMVKTLLKNNTSTKKHGKMQSKYMKNDIHRKKFDLRAAHICMCPNPLKHLITNN